MKSQTFCAPLALWLDPETALSLEHTQALQMSGWSVMPISTLDSLVAQASDATVLVLHLAHDVTRLKDVQQVLQNACLNTPVVCRVDRDDMDLAVDATQCGALTVLASHDVRSSTWQGLHAKLSHANAHAHSHTSTPPPQRSAQPVRNVVFVDPASQHLLALAKKVAQAEVTALLVGPTGAGKEVMARVLHEASGRARGPFVALNCAALPENLIEDMLFGHEKGAFTGAHREHKGVFEQAQNGTLFLDEIGEMPMHLQSKLLRVLQERQLTRLGGHTPLSLNVRVVAATNKDLKQAIVDREFREDLYYRIATFRLRLLPLCERPGDIIPLAHQCLIQYEQNGQTWHLHPQTQALLLQYPWPGNVRELENVMRRAMVLCADHHVTPAHLMFDECLNSLTPSAPVHFPAPMHVPAAHALPSRDTAAWVSATPAAAMPFEHATPVHLSTSEAEDLALHSAIHNTDPHNTDLHSATRLSEHQVIMATLASTPSKTEAAKRLGISPRTLRYKMAQLREHGLSLASAY